MPEMSSSRNSGRSFGRQVTSTSRAHVRHDAALGLDARGDRLALEVDRQLDADLLVLDDALQVDVHDGILRRVHLHVLDDRCLRLRRRP